MFASALFLLLPHSRRSLASLVERIGRIALVLAAYSISSFLHASEDFRRPNIEAVQRAIQERYLTWAATVRANGVEPEGFPAKITWPALSNGKQPGDSPKDCFYSEELIDAETG